MTREERVRLILAGHWQEALAAHPGWEEKLLAAMAPRKDKSVNN